MPSQSPAWVVYNRALNELALGDALWEPGPIDYSYRRVRLGDVGYTRDGSFHLLFSAGEPLGSRELGVDVPHTFEPLDVKYVKKYVKKNNRPPGYLRTETVRKIGAEVGGSSAIPCPIEPGASIAFELSSKQGAALITKYPTKREDAERQLTYKNYIKKYFQSWVDFSQERGHGDDIEPILVTGVDLTREFAAFAYSDNNTHGVCTFSAAVPAVASASASLWGSWSTGGFVHTNCGPYLIPATQGDNNPEEDLVQGSTVPDEYNQCVFIRYYTMRKRFFVPLVIKAGAGPHQLPKPDPSGDGTGEERLQPSSGDDSTEVRYSKTRSLAAVDEVIHNVPLVCPERYPDLPPLTNWTKDDRDGFDIVADFIFQRTKAESVLLHHDDIQNLLQEDEGETIRVLTDAGIVDRVEIDENGVGQLVSSGMPAQRSSADSSGPLNDNRMGGAKSGGSFIQTALLLGAGIGMSVVPQSLQFPPMPMSGIRPRDHKVLLVVLAHTVEAVGMTKEMVGINVVNGSLVAVESLLTSVKEVIVDQRDIAEVSIQCAQVFLIVKRGTLGKSEADVNPSILAATSYLTGIVEDIHEAVRQSQGRKRSYMVLHAKTDKDRITGWQEELANIMRILNSHLHFFVSNTGDEIRKDVKDIQRHLVEDVPKAPLYVPHLKTPRATSNIVFE